MPEAQPDTGVALVVGGSGAIGRATAVRLARLGRDVVIGFHGRKPEAETTAGLVRAEGRQAFVQRLDLADPGSVRAAIGEILERAGRLDTLVQAASPLNSQIWASAITPERYRDQLVADSSGTFSVISAALPALRRSAGCVVVVSTVANRRYVLRDVLSSAPKAANEALVKAIAAEEGRFGVRANAVGVGILDEGMTQALLASGDIKPGELDVALGRIPLRALGKASDIADAVAFLASPQAHYITGQWLDVDGGYSL
ncbi:SDR family oxidoreductase [Amycolatopsis sp. K13G38]|uniref:SDR family oxidoreductase n=1 Tax=Amycolatopsis acididurans TaxID=2724524 RepID=A0ABX1JCL6_9PSEU|nr:SDR family oxidoreductase [Amycolatopsis acididurans]NKQ57214.1 SDR family oxidoreductase [Amycolatopsis acididurans]